MVQKNSKTNNATDKQKTKKARKTQPPADNPESREKQLINKAINLAEKQIDEGTASPSIIAHFLKLGSEREKLERELIKNQGIVASVKAEEIKKTSKYEEGYTDVLDKISRYQGDTE